MVLRVWRPIHLPPPRRFFTPPDHCSHTRHVVAGDLVGIIGVRESEVFYATTSPYSLTVAGAVLDIDRLVCTQGLHVVDIF